MKTILKSASFTFLFFMGIHLKAQQENVGIGTEDPQAKLHVAGQLLADSLISTNFGGVKYPDGTIQVSASPFRRVGNKIINDGDLQSEDFLFGVNQIDQEPGLTAIRRLFFDISNSAFRVGSATSTDWNTDSLGTYSVGFGYDTKAIGFISTSMGANSSAIGPYSTSMGAATLASGQYSTSFGYSTKATSEGSTSLGGETEANGLYSTSLGYGNISNGAHSISMGIFTKANGDGSLAAGSDNAANGTNSVSLGSATKANGRNSISIGNGTVANGNESISMGLSTFSNGFGSLTIGVHNDSLVARENFFSNVTPLFIIGNGDSDADRRNAMVVRKDGKVGIGTSNPGNAISNAVLEVKGGHIVVANNFGFFSNNSSGAGFGAGIDTGSDDDLDFYTNGIKTMTLTATGSLGIGVENPSKTLEIFGGMKADGNTFNVDETNNRVGVGTSSPAKNLEIYGSSVTTSLTNSGSNSVRLEFKRTGGGSDWRIHNTSGILLFGQSDNDLSSVTDVLRLGGGSITPATDNNITLGQSGLRFTAVWATDGTINTSDKRLKQEIKSLESGMEIVKKLNPVNFKWRDNRRDMGKMHSGFIAQELQQIVPHVVIDHEWKEIPDTGQKEWVKTKNLGVNYTELIPILTKAIQEQQEQIDVQAQQLKEQQETIEKLMTEFKALQEKIDRNQIADNITLNGSR